MRTALVIAAAVALPLLLWLLMSLVAAAGRVWRGGVGDAREFDRADFSLKRFLTAQVEPQDSSSLVPTRAGIGVRHRNGRFEIRETRTISKETF